MGSCIPFKPGEIVTVRKDLKIRRVGKKTFHYKDNRRSFKAAAYKIDDYRVFLPYARGLLSKKFVVYYDEGRVASHRYGNNLSPSILIGDIVSITLLDNYKPRYYGKGWSFNARSFDLFESTGEFIHDFRKLPYKIRHTALSRISNKSIANGRVVFEGGNHEEKLLFKRKNVQRLFCKDLHESYAILNVANKTCQNCGQNLNSTETALLDLLDGFNIKKLEDNIRERYPRDINIFNKSKYTFAIFPVGYRCNKCACMSILVSTAQHVFNFSVYTLDTPSCYMNR